MTADLPGQDGKRTTVRSRRKPVPTMGPLEAAAMNVLWDRPDRYLKVRDVAEHLPDGLAYTTVMTLLLRLHDKGLLTRRRRGTAWVYRPRTSRSEYAARAMAEALHSHGDAPEVLFRFVEQLTPEELAALRQRLEEG